MDNALSFSQRAEACAFIITLDINKHQHYYFNGDVGFFILNLLKWLSTGTLNQSMISALLCFSVMRVEKKNISI